MPQLRGIDVAHYDNENTKPNKIDWKQVSTAGAKFVIIKASENMSADGYYKTNHDDAKAAGLLVGAYHFMRISASAKAQAKAFLDTAKLDAGDLLPALDVEVVPPAAGKKAFVDKIQAWLDIVSAKVGGKKPFIYTSKGMWDALSTDKKFAKYPLWVANYKVQKPKLPACWNEYVIWQYAEDGQVSGIKGNVDANDLAGDFSGLKGNYTI